MKSGATLGLKESKKPEKKKQIPDLKSSSTTTKPSTPSPTTPGAPTAWTGQTSPTLFANTPPLHSYRSNTSPPHHTTTTTTTTTSPTTLSSSPPTPQPLSLPTLSHLLYHSLSLSAWKSTPHSTWSLRVNPSSGNLHPTETHLISPPIPSLSRSAFAAHYAPKHHSLHLRSSPIPSQFFLPTFFPKSSFLVGFSSVFWREAWKYGERAFRYCNHDVGHAIAALAIAAAGLGWDVKILDGLGFCDLEKVMGMNGNGEFEIPARPVKGRMPEIEFDHPDCVVVVFPNGGEGFEVDFGKLSSLISEVFDEVEWVGKPNLLSKEHVCWDIIYRTAEAVKKPLTATDRFKVDPFVSSGLISENVYKGMSASEVIRKRRSAVDMDGVHVMERETFYQIMLHCLPSGVQSGDGGGKQGKQLALPFRVLTWEAEVHAVLFVHRVAGLPIGLYFLVRNDDHFDELKRSTRSEFEWERPEGCPANLPLYRLLKGDFKLISRRVSCHQVGEFGYVIFLHLENLR
ncbi:hypothetical protein Scep_006736 [Stephania cephalantha]|uniref:Nitroreductase n=1 Tax=Stephania cephalantha TaxID=152367 RepID=A0AAP0KAG3_9MAGN